MGLRIALDGPAGAGKSTIAKMVAEKLSIIYVDTGAMYRALGLYFLRQGLDGQDREAVERACEGADVSIAFRDGQQQVLLNGENVNGLIRTEEVGTMASKTSSYPKVREHLLQLQRELASSHDVIMDGRDIGTTVLPNAEVKIFLTADLKIRAKRRFLELTEKKIPCKIEEIESDMSARDNRDMTRKVSPLRKAEDAITVDSSEMTIEEVAERIVQIARDACGTETGL